MWSRLHRRAPCRGGSVASRHAEHMLAKVAQDHVRADRRHLIQAGFAELAFDVVFLGEAEAAMRVDAGLAGRPAGLGGQHLAHIGLLAAGQPGIEARQALAHDRLGGAHLRIGPRDRELHALVLADRAAEQHPFLGIGAGLGDEPFRIAHAFGGDQQPLGIHAIQDVAEAAPLDADQILGRHVHIVEEDLAGIVVHHGADRADGQALRRAHVDDEGGEALGLLRHLVARGGAGQQQHQVAMLGAAGPDFLAVDHVFVALAPRRCPQRGGVGATRGLGHAKSLQAQLALGDGGQVLRLLRRRAVSQDGAHDVHLRVAGGAIAAGRLHFLQDRRRAGQGQAGAAKFLGDQCAKVAALGQILR